MFVEPLEILPTEKWLKLEEVFQADGPRSITACIALRSHWFHLKNGLDFDFKVYCPFGDMRNGMVAFSAKRINYEVIIQCPRDDTNALEEALKTTKLINWTKSNIGFSVPIVPQHVKECLQRVIDSKQLKLHTTDNTIYVLEKTSPLFNTKLPPGLTFDILSEDHIDLVDSAWPHRHPGSNFYFELLIKSKMGYGLFKDKKLISWALIRQTGALLHLYTIEGERRKGYGELVLKLMSDILLKDGMHVVAYCVKGNVNAEKLYEKLNFLKYFDGPWCVVTNPRYKFIDI